MADVATSAIGFAGSPVAISAEARRANAEALRLHRDGNFAAARAGFERAATLAPAYAGARYNLACAMSRLGDQGAAARTISPLLEQDLPTFGRRLREDPDLAALRAAPGVGAGLLGRLDALWAAWARAAREGVPAVWVEDRLDVRPGVYLHAARRFVPLGPDEHDTLAALFDPASARSLYLVAVPSYDGISHLERARAVVHAADGSGSPAEWRADAEFCGALEAAAIPAGASLLAQVCSGDDAAPASAFELGAGGARVTWQGADGTGRSASTTAATIAASALVVRLATGVPEGFSVRGSDLVVPGREAPIRLGRGHGGADIRSVVLSPARDVAVVVSVHARCDCENDSSVERHVVERVTLSTGQVEPLSHGPHMAAARFGPDGALYVQAGDAVRRWASPDATTPETLPAGVLLGVLRFASGDCCSA